MGNCCEKLFKTRSNRHRRLHGWEATGVVGLRNERIEELPSSLKNIARKIKAIDASVNRIRILPEDLEEYSQLQRLILARNELLTLPESFARLTQLKILVLDFNKISTFPWMLCSVTMLEKLTMSSNCLTSLPLELSQLKNLKELDVSSNRISTIDTDFETLVNLESLNVSNNVLQELPVSLKSCIRLRDLLCEGNRLRTIPSEVLIHCVALQSLKLDGNLINFKEFEETEGYKELEKRRREKANKAISANVMLGQGTLNEAISRRT